MAGRWRCVISRARRAVRWPRTEMRRTARYWRRGCVRRRGGRGSRAAPVMITASSTAAIGVSTVTIPLAHGTMSPTVASNSVARVKRTSGASDGDSRVGTTRTGGTVQMGPGPGEPHQLGVGRAAASCGSTCCSAFSSLLRHLGSDIERARTHLNGATSVAVAESTPSAQIQDRGGVAASPEDPAPPMAAFFPKKLVAPATAAAPALRGWATIAVGDGRRRS